MRSPGNPGVPRHFQRVPLQLKQRRKPPGLSSGTPIGMMGFSRECPQRGAFLSSDLTGYWHQLEGALDRGVGCPSEMLNTFSSDASSRSDGFSSSHLPFSLFLSSTYSSLFSHQQNWQSARKEGAPGMGPYGKAHLSKDRPFLLDVLLRPSE